MRSRSRVPSVLSAFSFAASDNYAKTRSRPAPIINAQAQAWRQASENAYLGRQRWMARPIGKTCPNMGSFRGSLKRAVARYGQTSTRTDARRLHLLRCAAENESHTKRRRAKSRVFFSPCPPSQGQSGRQHRLAAGNPVTPVAIYDCRRNDRGWHHMRGERRITRRPARPGESGGNVWVEMRWTALWLVGSTRAPLARPRLG